MAGEAKVIATAEIEQPFASVQDVDSVDLLQRVRERSAGFFVLAFRNRNRNGNRITDSTMLV